LKTKEVWVRVRKASELRAGMTVQLRPCPAGVCGKTHTFILLGRAKAYPCNWCAVRRHLWRITEAGCVRNVDTNGVCMACVIAAGLLYRLSSAALSETDSTERAPRERELTNAKGQT
jgi:hypothetical protein